MMYSVCSRLVTALSLLCFASGRVITFEAEKRLNTNSPVIADIIKEGSLNTRDAVSDNLTLTSAYNFFIAPISVGTPPQSLQVALDTGSPFLWVFGANTSFGESRRFQPNNSATLEWEDRDFKASYGAGSVEGEWADDVIRLGNDSSSSIHSFPFGVIDSFQLNAGVPGLLGIGLGAKLERDYQNAPEALYVTNVTGSPAFSIHITSNATGEFIFGGYDKFLVAGPFYEFDIKTVSNSVQSGSSYYYQLSLTSVSFNGVPFRAYGIAILDTGSPFLLLPDPFVDNVGKSLGFTYSSDVNAYYASKDYGFNESYVVSIQFGEFTADIPITDLIIPTSYVWADGQGPANSIALAMLGSSRYLIGDPFFRHAYSVFDSWNKKIYLAKSRSGDSTGYGSNCTTNCTSNSTTFSTIIELDSKCTILSALPGVTSASSGSLPTATSSVSITLRTASVPTEPSEATELPVEDYIFA